MKTQSSSEIMKTANNVTICVVVFFLFLIYNLYSFFLLIGFHLDKCQEPHLIVFVHYSLLF